jgi:hypothetical protein
MPHSTGITAEEVTALAEQAALQVLAPLEQKTADLRRAVERVLQRASQAWLDGYQRGITEVATHLADAVAFAWAHGYDGPGAPP